jgi:hypothetical protein
MFYQDHLRLLMLAGCAALVAVNCAVLSTFVREIAGEGLALAKA